MDDFPEADDDQPVRQPPPRRVHAGLACHHQLDLLARPPRRAAAS